MPFFDTCVLLGFRDGGKDFCKSLDTMGRQLDCHVNGVNNPPQYELQRSPGAVSLEELFARHRFLSCRVVGWQKWLEEVINGVQEGSENLSTVVQVKINGNSMLLRLWLLCSPHKDVNQHICVRKWVL